MASTTSGTTASGYRAAGVDIDAGNHAVSLLAESVSSTRTPEVLSRTGSFAGLYSAAGLNTESVLVASTDGVGTKAALAAQHGRWRQIGVDLVNHCVGDVIVHGARPLFFLDYVAMGQLVPEVVAEIVAGIAEACKAAGCALLGGETAEMPGVYLQGSVDVVGTVVGVAQKERLLPRTDAIEAGDLLVGVASSGPHTNGYSLIRASLQKHLDTGRISKASYQALVDDALVPHRSYLPFVAKLSEIGVESKALAHITGGGFFDNLPRVLPPHLGVRIELGSWRIPALFATLMNMAEIDEAEAFRVWNMGIGLIAVVDQAAADTLMESDVSTGGKLNIIGAVVNRGSTTEAERVHIELND